MCLEGEKFPPQAQPAFWLHCAEHAWVTRPLHEAMPGDAASARGQPVLPSSPHPSPWEAFPNSCISSFCEQLEAGERIRGWISADAGTLLPSSGLPQLGLSVGRSKVPKPGSLRSTALKILDVPAQMDFRAMLRSICSPLPWTEVVQWRSFVACAPFVPE